MTSALTTNSSRRGGPGVGDFRLRKSFTLVELLVVIVIIGVLAGLIAVAAYKVRIAALNYRMKTEVMALDHALNAFKERFGCYPPCSTSGYVAVNAFWAKAFPRYESGLPTTNPFTGATLPETSGMFALDPSTALVFWLGGMQDANGNFMGFSANPTNPFDANPARIGPFFDFQSSRIEKTSPNSLATTYRYFPDNGLAPGISTNSPYLYFTVWDANDSGTSSYNDSGLVTITYQFAASTYTYTMNNKISVTCAPYVDTRANNCFVNPTTFQILCPGMDGVYGVGNSYPAGISQAGSTINGITYANANAYTPPNYDDITNFTVRATIGDDIPQ